MQQPLSFRPERQEINTVPIEIHNALVKELDEIRNELMRCRQKVAHLLKEKESREN